MDESLSLPVLRQQAIDAALTANWEKAISLNQEIIDREPNNVDTLNRMARAFFEIGQLNKAKKYYQEALQKDPYNQIAFKFIKRIDLCRKKKPNKINSSSCHHEHSQLSSDCFIEEPGKTRLVSLLKTAEPQKLSYLCPGEAVMLSPKNRYIAVTQTNGDYLGILPDDLSHRLIKFIHGGNKYQAFIKTVKTNGVTILIRETFRSSRFRNQPSFLENSSDSLIYSSDHIVIPDESEDSPPGEENLEEDRS